MNQIVAELKFLYLQVNTLRTNVPAMNEFPVLDWKITDNDLIELARSPYIANISFDKGKKTQQGHQTSPAKKQTLVILLVRPGLDKGQGIC
ncbi:hypothetical protein FACS1894169_04980 [Bacteroidia bacterium]|nr:hypothetical protein FACS1894169_04980 [Bacteroidia bacterium]